MEKSQLIHANPNFQVFTLLISKLQLHLKESFGLHTPFFPPRYQQRLGAIWIMEKKRLLTSYTQNLELLSHLKSEVWFDLFNLETTLHERAQGSVQHLSSSLTPHISSRFICELFIEEGQGRLYLNITDLERSWQKQYISISNKSFPLIPLVFAGPMSCLLQVEKSMGVCPSVTSFLHFCRGASGPAKFCLFVCFFKSPVGHVLSLVGYACCLHMEGGTSCSFVHFFPFALSASKVFSLLSWYVVSIIWIIQAPRIHGCTE